MININIDIKCADRNEAREVIEEIAIEIENGNFGAATNEAARMHFGGSVFVIESD